MAITLAQNFYKETVTVEWAAGAGNFYVSTKPTISEGYLVISPNNSSLREIVKFTATGTDGTGDYVTITAPNRGLGGTTDQTHAVGESVFINVTAETIQEISDALDQIVAGSAQDASTSTKGISKLSTAPVLASNPIAVGDNDPRIPDTGLLAFMSALRGMMFPYSGNSAPTGFLACDGASVDFATYQPLGEILLGRYGLPAGISFTADAGTDVITATSHGLSDDDVIILSSTDTLPAGLSANTVYHVISSTTNTFKVSTISGGSAVNITDAGTGTHYFHENFLLPDFRGSSVIGAGQKSIAVSFDSSDITPASVGTVSDTNTGGNITFAAAHGLSDGDSIIFASTFAGISAGTVYYVDVISSTVIHLHTSRDGVVPRMNEGQSGQVNPNSNGVSGAVAYKVGTFTSTSALPGILVDGTEVVLSTAGTLPTGLSAGTYYFVRLSDYTFQLAANRINAVTYTEGVAVSAAGSGSHTITMTLSSRSVGESGGAEEHQLMISELAEHDHNTYHAGSTTDRSDSGTGNSDTGGNSTGGDQPHNNMSPFVAVTWVIKT